MVIVREQTNRPLSHLNQPLTKRQALSLLAKTNNPALWLPLISPGSRTWHHKVPSTLWAFFFPHSTSHGQGNHLKKKKRNPIHHDLWMAEPLWTFKGAWCSFISTNVYTAICSLCTNIDQVSLSLCAVPGVASSRPGQWCICLYHRLCALCPGYFSRACRISYDDTFRCSYTSGYIILRPVNSSKVDYYTFYICILRLPW